MFYKIIQAVLNNDFVVQAKIIETIFKNIKEKNQID